MVVDSLRCSTAGNGDDAEMVAGATSGIRVGRIQRGAYDMQRIVQVRVALPVDGRRPCVRGHEAEEHAQGGGFAGAVGAEKPDDAAAFDREGDVVDGGQPANITTEVIEELRIRRFSRLASVALTTGRLLGTDAGAPALTVVSAIYCFSLAFILVVVPRGLGSENTALPLRPQRIGRGPSASEMSRRSIFIGDNVVVVERAIRRKQTDSTTAVAAERSQPSTKHSPPLTLASQGPTQLLDLQRSIGNGATVDWLQRKTGQDASSPVHRAIASNGSPLDQPTRLRMEHHLGADLSDVRVHIDARSAESVQASAYTVGNNFVLHPDHFSPGTAQGDHTLAHELTHVVQQRKGPVDGTPRAGGIAVSDPNDRFEHEAERSADTFSTREAQDETS